MNNLSCFDVICVNVRHENPSCMQLCRQLSLIPCHKYLQSLSTSYHKSCTTISYGIVCNTFQVIVFKIFLLPLFLPLVNCGMPVAPGNGSIVNIRSTLGGTEMFFRCDTGFVPTGSMRTVCTSDGISPNGTWTPNPATIVCIGK